MNDHSLDTPMGERALRHHAPADARRHALHDPAETDRLAGLLADGLGPYAPTAVATWNFQDEALACLVAIRLGVPGIYAFDDAGVASALGTLTPGDRVAAIAAAADGTVNVAAISAIARHARAELVAFGVIEDAGPHRESSVPVVTALR